MQITTPNDLAKGLIDKLPRMELSGEALALAEWFRKFRKIQILLIVIFVFLLFLCAWQKSRIADYPESYVSVSSNTSKAMLEKIAESDPQFKRALELTRQRDRQRTLLHLYFGALIVFACGNGVVNLMVWCKTREHTHLLFAGISRYRFLTEGGRTVLVRKR